MPYANILDKKTGDTFKAIDFGGPAVYKVNGVWVYGWTGATSVTFDGKVATLNPYNKTSVLEDRWEIISHQDIGKSSWRVTVKNHSTQEVKTGVYPFNLNGIVYELKDCAPGTWVIASCGGYKIESSWSGQQTDEVYRLKGTGEIVYTPTISCMFGPSGIGKNNTWLQIDGADGWYYERYFSVYPYYRLTLTVVGSSGYATFSNLDGEVALEVFFNKIISKIEFPEYKLIVSNDTTLNIKIFSKYWIGSAMRGIYQVGYWAPQRSYVDFTLTAKVGFLSQSIKDYFLSLSSDDFYNYF